jgi:hypothetical protein
MTPMPREPLDRLYRTTKVPRLWGQRQNRWLVAALGGAVPLPPARALQAHRSPWKIQQEVLGL